MFVTGCAGDADPHPFGTLDMARSHGEELGAAVKFVLDHPTLGCSPLGGNLRAVYAETTLHFAGPTDRASYEKRLGEPDRGRQSHAKRMIEAIDQGKPVLKEYPYYSVQAIALGDRLTVVALSGEVVVDYAIRLQAELGGEGRTLWVAAYANDVIGYIPSVRVLKEGGYEASDSFHGSLPGHLPGPRTSRRSSSRRRRMWSRRSGRSERRRIATGRYGCMRTNLRDFSRRIRYPQFVGLASAPAEFMTLVFKLSLPHPPALGAGMSEQETLAC